VRNATAQIVCANGFLPAGRKLQVGTYWFGLQGGPNPTDIYDHDLLHLLRTSPGLNLGGLTAYNLQINPIHPRRLVCDDQTYLSSKFCTLWKAFGPNP
jgi:hypothetical protein